MFFAAKALAFDIDYRRQFELFQKEGRLIRAIYYAAIAEDQEYSSIRPLIDWLDYNGYTTLTKRTREFTDSAARRKFRGNMDVE